VVSGYVFSVLRRRICPLPQERHTDPSRHYLCQGSECFLRREYSCDRERPDISTAFFTLPSVNIYNFLKYLFSTFMRYCNRTDRNGLRPDGDRLLNSLIIWWKSDLSGAIADRQQDMCQSVELSCRIGQGSLQSFPIKAYVSRRLY